jgi:hypothetical protein
VFVIRRSVTVILSLVVAVIGGAVGSFLVIAAKNASLGADGWQRCLRASRSSRAPQSDMLTAYSFGSSSPSFRCGLTLLLTQSLSKRFFQTAATEVRPLLMSSSLHRAATGNADIRRISDHASRESAAHHYRTQNDATSDF